MQKVQAKAVVHHFIRTPEVYKKIILFISMLMVVLLSVASSHAMTGEGQKAMHLQGLHQAIHESGQDHVVAEKTFVQGIEAFRQQQFRLAQRIWEPLAQLGHVESQFYMGVLSESKLAEIKDPGVAFNWYQQAADAGHSEAQHNVAVAYAKGEGVKLDVKRAVKWWVKAAQQGNADSQYNLGVLYAVGMQGVKQDMSKAKRWWLKAALRGDALAQYNLGALYAAGDGSGRNYCEAARWWQRSQQNGVMQAQVALHNLQPQIQGMGCR